MLILCVLKRSFWQVLLSILLLIFMPVLSVPVMAADLQVVTENWRPYNYSEKGQIKGLSTVIVKKVLKKAQISYSMAVYPWARAYKLAQSNKNMLIYTIVRIPAREKLFKWIRPLGKGGTTYLYRLKTNPHINPLSLEQARDYQVVTNRDTMDHLWLQSHDFKRLQTSSTIEHIVRMFFKGRGDMLAFNDRTLEAEFGHFGFDPKAVVPVMPLFKTPPYMAVSLGTSDLLVEKLQHAYDVLMQENKIQLVD